MKRSVRRRCWSETILATLSLVVLVVTLVSSDWIEIVLRVDPDRGDGTLEWAVVAVLAVTTLLATVAAAHDWRRAAASRRVAQPVRTSVS